MQGGKDQGGSRSKVVQKIVSVGVYPRSALKRDQSKFFATGKSGGSWWWWKSKNWNGYNEHYNINKMDTTGQKVYFKLKPESLSNLLNVMIVKDKGNSNKWIS